MGLLNKLFGRGDALMDPPPVVLVESPSPQSELARALAAIADSRAGVGDGFVNPSMHLGVSPYAGNDISSGRYGFAYLTQDRLSLEAMYRTSWIVGRGVDLLANDMVRQRITIDTPDSPETGEELLREVDKLGVWASLTSGLKWSRLYGGALVVLDIDGQDLATPLRTRTVGRGQFRGCWVFDRWQVSPSLNQLTRHGLPEYYAIHPEYAAHAMLRGKRVHHSRCIRLAGIELPRWQATENDLWGMSVVERLFDRLIQFDTVSSGAAQIINKSWLRVVKLEGFRQAFSANNPLGVQGLKDRFATMRQFQNNEGITLLDKEDEFQTFSHAFSGLDGVLGSFSSQVCGAWEYPEILFFGTSPSGIAGASGANSNIRLYYDSVRAAQENQLRRGVELLLEVTHQSLYRQPTPKGFGFEFAPLWQSDANERSTIAAQQTDVVLKAFESGLVSRTVALRELQQMTRQTGAWSNITPDDIAEAERLPSLEEEVARETERLNAQAQPPQAPVENA